MDVNDTGGNRGREKAAASHDKGGRGTSYMFSQWEHRLIE